MVITNVKHTSKTQPIRETQDVSHSTNHQLVVHREALMIRRADRVTSNWAFATGEELDSPLEQLDDNTSD